MANAASLSDKQAKALLKFLTRFMPESIDEFVEDFGQGDAFTIVLLAQRLREKYPEDAEA